VASPIQAHGLNECGPYAIVNGAMLKNQVLFFSQIIAPSVSINLFRFNLQLIPALIELAKQSGRLNTPEDVQKYAQDLFNTNHPRNVDSTFNMREHCFKFVHDMLLSGRRTLFHRLQIKLPFFGSLLTDKLPGGAGAARAALAQDGPDHH
jgi:hypothetical protein